MTKQLAIFFNGSFNPVSRQVDSYTWIDEAGQSLKRPLEDETVSCWPPAKPFDIKQVFLDKGQTEIGEFYVKVSSPSHLYHWLRSNDATQLYWLSVFSSAIDIDCAALPEGEYKPYLKSRSSEWRRLFELLATEGVAPNLKRLDVYWDCEGCHRGLGKSVEFVRALGKLRPQERVRIDGFYGVNWPAYLEREMGVPVIVGDPGWGLRGFQSNTRDLNP